MAVCLVESKGRYQGHRRLNLNLSTIAMFPPSYQISPDSIIPRKTIHRLALSLSVRKHPFRSKASNKSQGAVNINRRPHPSPPHPSLFPSKGNLKYDLRLLALVVVVFLNEDVNLCAHGLSYPNTPPVQQALSFPGYLGLNSQPSASQDQLRYLHAASCTNNNPLNSRHAHQQNPQPRNHPRKSPLPPPPPRQPWPLCVAES